MAASQTSQTKTTECFASWLEVAVEFITKIQEENATAVILPALVFADWSGDTPAEILIALWVHNEHLSHTTTHTFASKA